MTGAPVDTVSLVMMARCGRKFSGDCLNGAASIDVYIVIASAGLGMVPRARVLGTVHYMKLQTSTAAVATGRDVAAGWVLKRGHRSDSRAIIRDAE